MYNYEDYDNYYEPSIFDKIISETEDKIKDIIKEDIKKYYTDIINENSKLKTQNEEYKKRENEIKTKENNLKYKEDNLKREVEREFYESKIGDTLKQFVEDCELWFAENVRYQEEKCDLCNENRDLISKFPNGKETKVQCDCAKILYTYKPNLTFEHTIKFYKKNSEYYSDRAFYFSRSYAPTDDSRDYSYNEFKIGYIVSDFNNNTKDIYKKLSYEEKIGFRSKEECQKYCDWLNKKSNDKK